MGLKNQPNEASHNKKFQVKKKEITDRYLIQKIDKYKTYYNSIKGEMKVPKSKAYQ